MNKEIQYILSQLQESFNGDPWFGRNAHSLLEEVTQDVAMIKPGGQHSITELVWHMVNWREFVISRFEKDETKNLHYFEANDWRQLDQADSSLFKKGMQQLQYTQEQLIIILQSLDDDFLDTNVAERTYNFRTLLNGIVQHDIYHLGQVAYLVKFLKAG
ncbi:MAG TPA: DinB family protein [Flavisolibacter sp.]|nr:DinB family protein [Flavisolibacter sp.]